MVAPTPEPRGPTPLPPIMPLPPQDRIAAPAPIPLTSFVGRAQELATVAALLHRPTVRLLTLTGPGGIGKTRLALRAIETVRDTYGDGTAFVSLASVRDPELVAVAVALGLGVPDTPGLAVTARLRGFLQHRQFVLDPQPKRGATGCQHLQSGTRRQES